MCVVNVGSSVRKLCTIAELIRESNNLESGEHYWIYQCQSPGLSLARANKRNSPRGLFQSRRVMRTDVGTTTNCLPREDKRWRVFIYESLPPHIVHSACPCEQYTIFLFLKRLYNAKPTRWIIANKEYVGHQPQKENRGRTQVSSLLCIQTAKSWRTELMYTRRWFGLVNHRFASLVEPWAVQAEAFCGFSSCEDGAG